MRGYRSVVSYLTTNISVCQVKCSLHGSCEIGYVLLTSFGSNLFYMVIALGIAGIQTHLRAIV